MCPVVLADISVFWCNLFYLVCVCVCVVRAVYAVRVCCVCCVLCMHMESKTVHAVLHTGCLYIISTPHNALCWPLPIHGVAFITVSLIYVQLQLMSCTSLSELQSHDFPLKGCVYDVILT